MEYRGPSVMGFARSTHPTISAMTVHSKRGGALGSGGNGFLKHHDAVAGRAAQQLQRVGAARRGVAVRYHAFGRLYDDALCGHGSLLSRVPQSGEGPTISHW